MARASRSALITLLACCLVAAPAGAEIYRWTDAGGREHFSSNLDEVPPAHRDAARRKAESVRSRVNVVESAKPPAAVTPIPVTPSRMPQQAAPAAPAEAPGAEKIGGYDEAGWRMRAEKLRGEIERLEGEVEECKASAPVRWKPGAGRRAYDEEVNEAEACQRPANDLQYARIQLEKLEENAHKLGVPPGWIR